MTNRLKDALAAVNWNGNVSAFSSNSKRLARLTACCTLISIFAHELSVQDFDNPSIPFLQEMKASSFQVPVCLALGLAKPAAGLMRASVESALYYTYFRSHPQELRTLITKSTYYLSRRKIIEYHKIHTHNFGALDPTFNFISKLETWYGEISAIVHGQIPGVWTSKSLVDTIALKDNVDDPLRMFERAANIIQLLFLTTISLEDWEGISPISRGSLLKGITDSQLSKLGLSRI